LVGLLIYTCTEPLWHNPAFPIVSTLWGVILVLVYIWGISKLFPFTFIDTGRPSTIATFRTVIKYAGPVIIAGLLVPLIIKWFSA
jgi:hypothetical protein